jgi:hypothetical protein
VLNVKTGASAPTRIDMAEALVRHCRSHLYRIRNGLPHFEVDPSEISDQIPFPQVKIVNAVPPDPSDPILWEIEVKHGLEDLRSALEYCAMEAYTRSSGPPQPGPKGGPRAVHFPCFEFDPAATEASEILRYEDKINRDFPDLAKVYPDARRLMREAQAFRPSDDLWLRELHDLWNEVKHSNLAYVVPRQEFITLMPNGPGDPMQFYQVLRFALTDREVQSFFDIACAKVEKLVDQLRPALGLPPPNVPAAASPMAAPPAASPPTS